MIKMNSASQISNASERSESIGYNSSKSGFFEPLPDQLSIQHLKQIAYELGLISLCWPHINNPEFEHRKHYPDSYLTNSKKEKLALLYAENFRKQFINLYPQRRQLVLATDNECGRQKLVCTTLRPTALPYTELKTWDTCAQFVADHINYEVLEKPTLIPERILSPNTVFRRQSGHSYEIATALCSLLLAAGYAAYVVSGYATRDIALKILCRTDCPIKPLQHEVADEEEDTAERKYRLRSVRDLRSKFLMYMEQREIDRAEEEKQRQKELRLEEMRELEKPPVDELYGWRVHGWVLLLPKREIKEPTFIEPSTGIAYPTSTDAYISVESIWNTDNYWVNIQDMTKGIGHLKFDLTDLTCWEHLFIGEPIDTRRLYIDPDSEYDPDVSALDEKHLDMPAPWSEPISIPHDMLKTRYANGVKTSRYKRAILNQYGEYVQLDGLKHRVTYYSDLNYENAISIEECYQYRQDCLTTIFRDLQTELVTEYFRIGREDACKLHSYYVNDISNDSRRTMEFYDTSRIDGLSQLEMHPLFLKEYFCNREDRLYFRYTKFAPRGKPPRGMVEGVRRIVTSIIEQFERDESKSAHDDIAQREFALVQNEILIKYHYAKGKVTASTRDFVKPNVAEMGEDLTFNPELTSGYLAEVGTKPPKQLQLFYLLKTQLDHEEKVLFHLREIEDEVSMFVRARTIESAVPKLKISLFNREQNDDYKQGLKEREQQVRECKEREVDEDIDYLAPFLMRLDPGTILTKAQALAVRDQCLADFRQLLVDRANTLQQQFDRDLNRLMREQNVYESKIGLLTREEEEVHLKEFSRKKGILHMYEIRLQRHKDLSPYRYQALELYLDADKRLSALKY